jgi:hypothetical protein
MKIRCNDLSILIQAIQTWEHQGMGFPSTIEEELLEHALTDEHVRVVFQETAEAYVRIEGWVLDLLRIQSRLESQALDELVRSGYRGHVHLEKQERGGVYISKDWTLQYTIFGPGDVRSVRIDFSLPGSDEFLTLSSEFSVICVDSPNWKSTCHSFNPDLSSSDEFRHKIERTASRPAF